MHRRTYSYAADFAVVLAISRITQTVTHIMLAQTTLKK